MPGARRDTFKKGGGGILRKVDGTIVGLQFSDTNPNVPVDTKKKKSDFRILWALLSILQDGATEPVSQGLFVGSADDFGITEDEMGITGEGALGRSEWTTFYDSLVEAGFPEEDRIPVDPEGIVADYSGIVGVRAHFDWQVNEWKTKNLPPKPRKDKDGKPMKGKDGKPLFYPREDLIVTQFHDIVEVDEAPVQKTTAPKSTAKSTKKAAAAEVDIEAITSAAVQAILSEAKDNRLLLNKVSVKLLNKLNDQPAEVREQARTWLDKNPTGVAGVDYDEKTKTLSV